jgi:hypothetical protein
MIVCGSCNKQVPDTSAFCDQCGQPLTAPYYYAPYIPPDLGQQIIQLLAQTWNEIDPAERAVVLNWLLLLLSGGAYWVKEKLEQWLADRRRRGPLVV